MVVMVVVVAFAQALPATPGILGTQMCQGSYLLLLLRLLRRREAALCAPSGVLPLVRVGAAALGALGGPGTRGKLRVHASLTAVRQPGREEGRRTRMLVVWVQAVRLPALALAWA